MKRPRAAGPPRAGRGDETGDAGRDGRTPPPGATLRPPSSPTPETLCGNCHGPAGVEPEVCWYCDGPLCGGCHDEVGHCGHPEAEALNQAARDHKPGDPLLPRPWVREEIDEWAASFDGPVASER